MYRLLVPRPVLLAASLIEQCSPLRWAIDDAYDLHTSDNLSCQNTVWVELVWPGLCCWRQATIVIPGQLVHNMSAHVTRLSPGEPLQCQPLANVQKAGAGCMAPPSVHRTPHLLPHIYYPTAPYAFPPPAPTLFYNHVHEDLHCSHRRRHARPLRTRPAGSQP